MNSTVKTNLIQLAKGAGAMAGCAIQVLIFFQFVPFGGFYIGLLSLILDLTIYCWLVSGACKALNAPPRPGPTKRSGTAKISLLLNKHL